MKYLGAIHKGDVFREVASGPRDWYVWDAGGGSVVLRYDDTSLRKAPEHKRVTEEELRTCYRLISSNVLGTKVAWPVRRRVVRG